MMGPYYNGSSDSTGLYGSSSSFGGTYFEWFIFRESATAPATPTGGSWSFTTNVGTAPAVSAAGATQATATALVSNINNVTVVAAAADGVRLPTAVAGMRILIRNSDALDTLMIYPATGGQINALGANTASTLVAGLTVELMATTTTQWYTF